jgi:3-deoxy-alpha-D-manno-octulosonate 8-oxidase
MFTFMNTLNTSIRNARNVKNYIFGSGSFTDLLGILNEQRKSEKDIVVYFIDGFFEENHQFISYLEVHNQDELFFVPTDYEPSTEGIDEYINNLRELNVSDIAAIVAIGGGITLDTAKAVSNLLTNHGEAADYQGWDLVKVPGVYKIAVPSISGTGAEATRTCVMTNKNTGLKLGMNSDYTVFDQVILDPDLTKTVPRDQYFWTGMDAYIHCIEALSGKYRNAIGDAFARETVNLCRAVFLCDDMMSDKAREQLMVASYLGGCAIATSYVGVVHPFSAGLSVVLGLHHCIANCITMRAMREFYPNEYDEFWSMVDKQNITIPKDVCCDLTEVQYDKLYKSTIVHEKPLTNALGGDYKKTLTREKIKELFLKM